jgi:predicted nucleic acid-binding protein
LPKKKKALFLVNDIPLANLAEMYNLRAWDTWTLLLESQSRNLIRLADVESAIEELGKKKFRLNAKQVEEILKASKTSEKEKNRSKVFCDPS